MHLAEEMRKNRGIRTDHALTRAQLVEEWLNSTISTRRKTSWRGIGLIVGPAGGGKTTALDTYRAKMGSAQETEILLLKAQAEEPPAAMLRGALAGMGEQANSRTVTELTGEVAAAIERHEYAAVVLDQAEVLQRTAFDIWRAIYDKTGCLLVFAGRTSLTDKVRRDQKLWSRVGRQLEVPPPSPHEVLGVILPSLEVPLFRFNPAVPADRALGEALWRLTQPSLRDLRTVLLEASEVAGASHMDRIGLNEIHRAFGRTAMDKPAGSWARLMWAVAVTLLYNEYQDAYLIIEQGLVNVNGAPITDWWWVVQAGDVIESPASETRTQRVILEGQHLQQARRLLERIAQMKPGGIQPYL